jgi:hypothetical protein
VSAKHRVDRNRFAQARWLLGLLATVGIAAAAACGADPSSANRELDAGLPDGATFGDGGIGTKTGVVILHAAAFPAFRLCFERYPELQPQPDRAVMPQANVVGVDVGSIVRIGPLEKPPGDVYVVLQRSVVAGPGATEAKTCGELLENNTLLRDIHYHVAGRLEEPLGVDRVDLLAITGCGARSVIRSLGVPEEECGPEWDATSGSLLARTLALHPTGAASARSLPVQVVHMAPLLEAKRRAGEEIEVTFGPLDADTGPLARKVASSPPLFEASPPVTLDLDQTDVTTYGTHGFRIALRGPDAGVPFHVDQTLADIQELSTPQAVATTYYLAASSYALLLVGDPRVSRTHADGGSTLELARRSVHLLAVPIRELWALEQPEAGAESPDGGT